MLLNSGKIQVTSIFYSEYNYREHFLLLFKSVIEATELQAPDPTFSFASCYSGQSYTSVLLWRTTFQGELRNFLTLPSHVSWNNIEILTDLLLPQRYTSSCIFFPFSDDLFNILNNLAQLLSSFKSKETYPDMPMPTLSSWKLQTKTLKILLSTLNLLTYKLLHSKAVWQSSLFRQWNACCALILSIYGSLEADN